MCVSKCMIFQSIIFILSSLINVSAVDYSGPDTKIVQIIIFEFFCFASSIYEPTRYVQV